MILLAIIVVPIAWLFATQERDPAPAQQKPVQVAPVQMNVRQGALICYSRESWESMLSGIADNNYQQIGNLLKSAECQRITAQTAVTRIDNAGSNAALIQMPSGRSAVVFNQDLSSE